MSNPEYDPYTYLKWGVYDTQPNEKGELDKTPRQFSDPRYRASHYNPAHWTDYQTAVAFCRAIPDTG